MSEQTELANELLVLVYRVELFVLNTPASLTLPFWLPKQVPIDVVATARKTPVQKNRRRQGEQNAFCPEGLPIRTVWRQERGEVPEKFPFGPFQHHLCQVASHLFRPCSCQSAFGGVFFRMRQAPVGGAKFVL